MSELVNNFSMDELTVDEVKKELPKPPNNYKTKRLVIVDNMNIHYIILSDNRYGNNIFLLEIKNSHDDNAYENNIFIKIGYSVNDTNNRKIAENIYGNIMLHVSEKERIIRKNSDIREDHSEIHLDVIEVILTGKTSPNNFKGEYKIICNALTSTDEELINGIAPIVKSDCDCLFTNQINFLNNVGKYGDGSNDYNIINYTFENNINSEVKSCGKNSLTIFNSDFYFDGDDISFYNVDGLIMNSSFNGSTIRNLSMTMKYIAINYSKLYCESEEYRHRLRNLIEEDNFDYYTGKNRLKFGLYDTELWIFSDSQDPYLASESGEEGYIYVDIPNNIKLINGSVGIDAGSISPYSTVKTNEEDYRVDFTGMNRIDDSSCLISLAPDKDHTVKYLGTISLFNSNMKLTDHNVHLYEKSVTKMIFIRYGGLQLTSDSLLSHLKRTNKKIYKLNKNIISDYVKTILSNRID